MNLIGTFSFKFYSVHSVSVSLEEKQTNKKKSNVLFLKHTCVSVVIKKQQQQQQKLLQFQSSQSIQGIAEFRGGSNCAECWSWKEK